MAALRNISHEILREWFRRWYRYATLVRQNPIASAVPYRLKRLAICQDALETVMLRDGISQEEIEGMRAQVEGESCICQCFLGYGGEVYDNSAECPVHGVDREGSCLRGPEEMRGCPGPDYITCPGCVDWQPAEKDFHKCLLSAEEFITCSSFAEICAECRGEGLTCQACHKPAQDIIHPHKIPAGQEKYDREFRAALQEDQTKCQRGDWGLR